MGRAWWRGVVCGRYKLPQTTFGTDECGPIRASAQCASGGDTWWAFVHEYADALWDDSQRRSQQVERPVAVEVAKFCRCSVRVSLIVCLEAVVWLLLPLRLWVKLTLHALQMLRGGVGERRAGARHGCTKHRPLRTTTSIRKYLRGAKFVYFHIGQFLRVTGR